MPPRDSPLLTFSDTVLWLKVMLSAAALVLLILRYKKAKTSNGASPAYAFRTKALLVLAIAFSFAVFHNFGSFRAGSFVHYGEMFHYYLGSKYFDELGYYDLYNAVIVADTEQGNVLAGLPFYTDLRSYQNAPREAAIRDAARVKGLFSTKRWNAFKRDVLFFRKATDTPHGPGLVFLLMDHGYNASPVATSILGLLTNAVSVAHVTLLASFDVILVAATLASVFRAFGFDMGVLFSVYFFVNIFNDQGYISGGLLRYDWLFCSVAAVCLLEKRRHASSAFFLTLAAMLRIFPGVLFCGIAVSFLRRAKAARSLDGSSLRFIAVAGGTALALFLLPAVSLGSVLQPWKDFTSKTALHDDGVYVNHVGFRAMALFEPSHLSLEKFVATYNRADNPDIVRNWQTVKERELAQKRPALVLASLFVLACLTAILWRRKADEVEGAVWSLLLVYTMSFMAHYYYAFLCLFMLLFFRRRPALDAIVPLCLLFTLNICALVTDSFRPSPIVFYTLINIYLFVCFASMLGFEMRTSVFGKPPLAVPSAPPPPGFVREVKKGRQKARARRNKRR